MSDTEKLTFKGFMKASGNTETLEKRPNVPASQAYDGWKSSKEYKKDTLIGNWIEERFKLQDLSKRRPLPSQYGHNYLTTYKQGYRSNSLPRIPEFIKYSQQGWYNFNFLTKISKDLAIMTYYVMI